MIRYGKLLVVLGLALGLAACGGDDDGDGNGNGGGACAGAGKALLGSCVQATIGLCLEYHGPAELYEVEGVGPDEECGEDWLSGGCPAEYKAGGGCATGVSQAAVVFYSTTSQDPDSVKADCEAAEESCYVAP
jgi:hypothetical protein